MAKPINPLDDFVTYTYHFELHAAPNWDDLAALKTSDPNRASLPSEVVDTLIINTRRDAHQVIEELRFDYATPVINPHGLFTAHGECQFVVREPNGAQFIEKLTKMYTKYHVSSLQSLQFALKIFFVGRLPNNSIVTRAMNGILPLTFVSMDAGFTYEGGEYHMRFACTSAPLLSGVGTTGNDNNQALSMGYFPKSIPIKALTVREALSELESRLNSTYEKIYSTELKNSNGSRVIKYFIHNHGVDGNITVQNRETTADDEPATIMCDQQQTILMWIYNIVRSSKELNERVGKSRENLHKEGQPGVELISVNPRVLLKDGVTEIHFDVQFYRGRDDDLYEFDFMFATPGKNVDVMGFDIRMNQVEAWLSNKSKNGVDYGTDMSATVRTDAPRQYAVNICVPDIMMPEQKVETVRTDIPTKKNDTALLPAAPRYETSGHIKQRADAVPAARLMFETVSDAHGAVEPQLSFTIRGHQDLLERGLIYPDGSKTTTASGTHDPLGVSAPTHVKVNIKSPDQGHPAFFYTGKYLLTAISNVFTGGRFTQSLTVNMLTKDQL